MKSKFANLKDLKSVDGGVYENLEYYARVVAEKYGGRKEEAMREHLVQMFKSLDKIGVLQYVNQKELSRKVLNRCLCSALFVRKTAFFLCTQPVQ